MRWFQRKPEGPPPCPLCGEPSTCGTRNLIGGRVRYNMACKRHGAYAQGVPFTRDAGGEWVAGEYHADTDSWSVPA